MVYILYLNAPPEILCCVSKRTENQISATKPKMLCLCIFFFTSEELSSSTLYINKYICICLILDWINSIG